MLFRSWRPREEILADGTTRYLYKRRTGEADLSLAELRQAIDSPPTFEKEHELISQLIRTLRKAGVRIVLMPPIKQGAAAEWDHRQGTLRIQPEMWKKGSVDFLHILNHEAIHVAQSCKGGALKAPPAALGIRSSESIADLDKKLKDPVYSNTSRWERNLELEAYGLQSNSEAARQIVESHCKLAMNMTN